MSKDTKKRENIKTIDKMLNIYDIGNIAEKIKSDANAMYRDLGNIDTKALYKSVVLDDNPLFDIENFTEFDIKKTYIDILDDITNNLKKELKRDASKLSKEELKDIVEYINLEVSNFSNNLLLDNVINRAINLASKFSSAIANIQVQEIKDTIGIDAFYNLTDFTKLPFKAYVSPQVLYRAKSLTDNKALTDEIYKIKSKEELLELDINGSQQAETLTYLEYYINQPKFRALIEEVNDKTNTINELFDKVFKKYNIQIDYQTATKKVVKHPTNKEIDLYSAKIFNNIYPFNKYTSIDKNGNGDLDIQLNISADADSLDDIKDLRDIIFIDEYSKKQLPLLPIDLALFVAITSLNNANNGNVPISLTDAFKYMSENANVKIKKGDKGYNTYINKMRAFKTFKAKSVIKDRATNKELIRFNDAIPILENYEVIIGGKIKYIVGASAVLTILNWLSDNVDVDYKTTYSIANQYINDNQNNTIEILNIKYYLIIKVLQIKNRADKSSVFNPKIPIDELYKQTAFIKGKDDLSKTERARVRASIDKFMEHLKRKELIKDYSYTPIGTNKASNQLSNVKKDDIYIKA